MRSWRSRLWASLVQGELGRLGSCPSCPRVGGGLGPQEPPLSTHSSWPLRPPAPLDAFSIMSTGGKSHSPLALAHAAPSNRQPELRRGEASRHHSVQGPEEPSHLAALGWTARPLCELLPHREGEGKGPQVGSLPRGHSALGTPQLHRGLPTSKTGKLLSGSTGQGHQLLAAKPLLKGRVVSSTLLLPCTW